MFGTEPIFKKEMTVTDGELDLSLPLYVSKSRNTKIDFVLLSGYNTTDERVALTDSKRMVSHSIQGENRKVSCARRLQKYLDKSTGKEKYGYDSMTFLHCELCERAEESASKNNNIATEYQKAVEVDFVIRLISHTSDVPKLDSKGEIVKNDGKIVWEEKHQEFPENTIAIARLTIADAYFPTSKNGVATDLKRLVSKVDKKTGKNKLESHVISWSASSEGILFDEVEEMSKELSKEVEALRKNFIEGEYDELLESNSAVKYSDWYEQEFGEVYISPLKQKKSFSKKPVTKKEEVELPEEAPY